MGGWEGEGREAQRCGNADALRGEVEGRTVVAWMQKGCGREYREGETWWPCVGTTEDP